MERQSYDFSTFCSKFAVLIVRPPSELGSLAAKIELFDSSSSSIFIPQMPIKQQTFADNGKGLRVEL